MLETETSRAETITAALLYLMTHYARTGCPRLALCVDMLGPEGVGELIGGSQREDDLDALVARIREHGLGEEHFQWYLDLRRYGSVPHAGFGLGLERFVGWIAGVEHIRECSPFPRMMYRIQP